MIWVALKMLTGHRAKYFGVLAALAFTSFVMTQQPAMLFGILKQMHGSIDDIGNVDLWVVDPHVQYVDDIKAMPDTALYRVRGVPGVAWAVPLFKGNASVRLDGGNFQNAQIIGIDDASLIGGPRQMTEGSLADLRNADAIIVDAGSASGKLLNPDGSVLQVGSTVEMNDHRAKVVGMAQARQNFQSIPTIWTTYSQARVFAPQSRRMLSFILARVQPGKSREEVARDITRYTGLAAYPTQAFIDRTVSHMVRNTGIVMNFGFSTLIAFVVGAGIAGQTFYNFTLDNLRYFGALKAIGVGSRGLIAMVLAQAFSAGAISYGIGLGAAAVASTLMGRGGMTLNIAWYVLAGNAASIALVCSLAALLSLRKVLRLEPAMVFRG